MIKIAMNVAFGVNTPYFGRPITIAFLVGSLILITIIAALGNRTVRSFSVLISLVVVYIVGFLCGLDDLTKLAAAPFVKAQMLPHVPQLLGS